MSSTSLSRASNPRTYRFGRALIIGVSTGGIDVLIAGRIRVVGIGLMQRAFSVSLCGVGRRLIVFCSSDGHKSSSRYRAKDVPAGRSRYFARVLTGNPWPLDD